ncbi:MAG: hypothetical protein ACFFBX_07495 [Promethearchaeota archaeon]
MSKPAVSAFRQAVYNEAKSLKIPIVDERAIDKLGINKGSVGGTIDMRYRDGEETKIKTFLAVAKYHHALVIYKDESFFIITSDMIWRLST